MSIQDLLKKAQFTATSVDAELYASTAEELAKLIANSANHSTNKGTQLRRFYDEVCYWQDQTRRHPEKFDEYLPFIQMIRARVAYAKGRKLVDDNFYHMLDHCLRQISAGGGEVFNRFKLFFEAFMGYYKMYNDK
jgi:CRISPR-associated protein Csm2